MKHAVKIILAAAVCILAVVFAVYTEPLDAHREAERMAQFQPEEMADYHWDHDRQALRDQALGISALAEGLERDADGICNAHGRVLGIGSRTFFVVKGTLPRFEADEEYLTGECDGYAVCIPIRYIFGNLARDASGWFRIDDFQNTMAFNEISSYLNGRILQDVIPASIPQAGSCFFCGAVEIDPSAAVPGSFKVIPYILEFHE